MANARQLPAVEAPPGSSTLHDGGSSPIQRHWEGTAGTVKPTNPCRLFLGGELPEMEYRPIDLEQYTGGYAEQGEQGVGPSPAPSGFPVFRGRPMEAHDAASDHGNRPHALQSHAVPLSPIVRAAPYPPGVASVAGRLILTVSGRS